MSFAPRHVLIAPYFVMSWLYKPLIPALRARFDARFTLLVPEGSDVATHYEAFLQPSDRVVAAPGYVEMSRRGADGASEDALFDGARAFERRNGARILRDVVQQERDQAWSMVAGAWRLGPSAARPSTMAEHCAATLGFAAFYEALFDADPVDLALLWPRSGGETVGALIARRRGVAVSYPYTGKHKNVVYWAHGPFGEPDRHFAAFDAVVAEDAAPAVGDLEPPGRPAALDHSKLAARYGFIGTLKKCFIAVLHAAEHAALDLRAGRWRGRKRASLRRTLAKTVKDWFYYRRFDALCEKDFDRVGARPFVLYAFQNEPEFSVQARSKEFSDQGFAIRQLAKSLPADVLLVIKEHAWIGDRSLEFYKELLAFPNVVMAHPAMPAADLVPRALGVASLAGTVTLEAAALGRRAVIFTKRSEFARLPSVLLVDRLDGFDAAADWLAATPSDAERAGYREAAAALQTAIERIGVDAPQLYTKEGFDADWPHLERAVDLLLETAADVVRADAGAAR